ncbi:hypothetical protein VPH35_008488 [Triticum aestivum]
MAPTYESAEEWNDETTVDLTINRNGPGLLFPGREGTESNAVQYLSQKCSDASRHSSLNLPMEGVTHIPGAGSITNLQAANGWNVPRPRIDLNNTAGDAASVPSSGVVSSDTEPEKVWHYKDPSGNVQGPFTLSQLSKWTTYFPSGMKIWLTFESEENSLLLTEVLSTQQKDIIQPTPVINNNKSAWAGSGQDRINPSMTGNITSPIGYNVGKTKEIMNLQKPCPPDASNASVNQLFEPKIDSVLSPGTQDQYPSPNPKFERKQPVMNKSGSTSVAPEDSATKAYDHSSIDFVSETSGPPSSKFVGLQLLKETQTSCVEERDLKDGGCVTQTAPLKGDATSAKRDNITVSSVSDAGVCDVLGSLTEPNCGTYNVHAGMPLENVNPASAEEERPQCSSPIALSPWGEPSYYQGGAVDSALWGVQDDPSNDIWSLSSPTPALQPSSDLGADGKDTSCILEEAVVARGNSAVGEIPPTPEEKMEKGNPSASTDCGVPGQVKLKPSAALLNSSLKSTEASGGQPLGSSLEGSTKASGRQPVGSFLDGNTKVSGRQASGQFLEGSTKASGWQSGSSLETSTKGSGWGSSVDGSTKGSGWGSSVDGSTKGSGRGLSLEVNTKGSGWGSSLEGGTKGSGWGSSLEGGTKGSGWGSSLEGSTQASGWLRSSSSPEGRKTPGRHSSARESSKVNFKSGSQNRNSSSGHQTTPTAKSSAEAQRRQGSTNSNSAGWGEAPGSNKSWHPSSGSASRGSQSNQHHDRHSHGNESRRGSYQGNDSRPGSSNHSRRSSDHRQDHGSGMSSRSSSRGQSQRGICKYYENGHCWKGPSCSFVHR